MANPARRDLVVITAGLELDGGGRAVVGRLLAAGARRFAAEQGVSCRILSLGDEQPLPPPLAFAGCRGSRLGLARRTLKAQLAAPRPALLFDLLGPARLEALLPPALCAPYGVFLHGVEVFRELSPLAARTLEGARVLLTNSRYTRERARPFLGAAAERVEVLPLALEERPVSGDVDAELLARAGEGFFLIAGRMSRSERYKGHDLLLRALAKLEDEPRARLLVAGGGDDRERLAAESRTLGLADRVTFLGFVKEATLAALYERCLALVMPSRDEGFGLVYLEAMRAGKPAIGARGSAAEEVLADGEAGLLVETHDAEELAQALRSLLRDGELRARLGAAGRARFEARHRFDRFASNLAPHLERLTRP